MPHSTGHLSTEPVKARRPSTCIRVELRNRNQHCSLPRTEAQSGHHVGNDYGAGAFSKRAQTSEKARTSLGNFLTVEA